MAGRAYDPRFVFSWPNHRIAVMGGAQLGGVMSIIRRSSAARAGRDYDEDEDARVCRNNEGRVWDDGVIDPRHTRTVLGLACSATHSASISGATRFAPFRM
jgi:acetyl-CoA carboxylase carboxyltransferase component